MALAALLAAARQPTWRIWAEASPFEAKDILKARGYRWSSGEDGRRKSWYADLRSEAAANEEIEWLRAEIYRDQQREFTIGLFTARDRFSERLENG